MQKPSRHFAFAIVATRPAGNRGSGAQHIATLARQQVSKIATHAKAIAKNTLFIDAILRRNSFKHAVKKVQIIFRSGLIPLIIEAICANNQRITLRILLNPQTTT